MKVQVIKLTAFRDEEIMLIAPKEMLSNFVWYLKAICYNAIDGATSNNNFARAEEYYAFVEELNDIIKEIEDDEIQGESLE